MNRTFIPIGIVLACAAMAAGAADPMHATFKTHAQVRSELLASIARGERLPSGEAQYETAAPLKSGLSRADVEADLLKSLRAGYHPPAGEASYMLPMTPTGGASREQIANELRMLIKQGVQLPHGEAG